MSTKPDSSTDTEHFIENFGKLMAIQHYAVFLIKKNIYGDGRFLPRQPEAPAHPEESLQIIGRSLSEAKILKGEQANSAENAGDTPKEVASGPENTESTQVKTQPSHPVDHPPQQRK
ncbi:hypothetical protein E0E50_13420 [Azotobacter chroococcum subsp. isscasi]|uniref:hypothetical protein n=1 Tax=Azotobacter chroococcum TaxID=353 RepID=UPI00103B52CF|nr:hypothetical protein [Azotobacter chroococcum]TBW09815.1 hypothetical protein E0E50_13420 [Azotobacter chroococcum subsp. isscasi]